MHYRYRNPHLEFMSKARWNVQKMFTPPKEKDPWTAMTKGSTGGWAAPFAKPAALLPAAAALAALPVTGGLSGALLPQLAALGVTGAAVGGIQGATTGIWGKPGSGAALLKGALYGGGQGMGVSGLGQVAGSLMPATTQAPTMGSNAYLNSLIAKNAGIQSIATPISSLGLGAGAGATAAGSLIPSVAGTLGTMGAGQAASSLMSASPGIKEPETLGGGTYKKDNFNLENIFKYIMGTVSAIPPQGSPDIAKERVSSPNLEEARGMIRDLALASPGELLSPASDEFINASLRQNRDAVAQQKQFLINEYSKRGKVLGKSGGLEDMLARYDKEQIKREQDYITSINEARYIAAVGQKIKAVKTYYDVSEEEAADMLAAEGYIDPQEAANYLSMLSSFNQVAGMF